MTTRRKTQQSRAALANAAFTAERGPAAAGAFVWQEQDDPIFGHAWWLRGLKEGESATCRRSGSGLSVTFVAQAFINGQYMNHRARSMGAAMSRLEAEMDKRSLGLFGLDDVAFSRKEASK